MKVDIGLPSKSMKKVADELIKVLANNTILYMKTHGFHWNVTGPHFSMHHQMFEEQYNDLFEAQDIIAERIRSLGELAPNSYKELLKHASIKESSGNLPARDMLKALLKDNETMINNLRKSMEICAKHTDEGTFDMLVERLQTHEKHAWMLRATLS